MSNYEPEVRPGTIVKWGLVAVVVILALTWIFQGNEFFMYKVFAPATEQVRRETFEQTKSYRQGMIQELENMQFEYVKADDKHKDALSAIIVRRAADFDLDKTDVSVDLRSFIQKLRRDRTTR